MKLELNRRIKSFAVITLTMSFLAIQASGQTFISGAISTNTTWTVANSPYIVTGNTVVMSNVTLDIEPGVIVKFDSNVQLLLRGKLHAHGTESDTIRFLANDNVNWWFGIGVDNSSYNPKVDLRYLKATNASTLFDVATVGSTDTLLKLVHSTFSDNQVVIDQYDGEKTHLVYVDWCLFENNSNYINPGASNNIILNSRFHGNYRALYNNTDQATVIDRCEFSGFSEGAVAVEGIITNSDFHDNQRGIITMGLNSPIIHNNYIHDNETGIEAWNYGSSNSVTQINFNKICNNTNGIKKIYGTDTYAPNNCWCMNDSALIQSTIFDFFDAPNLGFIYYTPFDEECSYSGISSTQEVQSDLEPKIQVFPNPTTGEINLRIGGTNTLYKIEVFNPIGQLCYVGSGAGANTTELHLTDYLGVHLIRISDDRGFYQILKVVKE